MHFVQLRPVRTARARPSTHDTQNCTGIRPHYRSKPDRSRGRRNRPKRRDLAQLRPVRTARARPPTHDTPNRTDIRLRNRPRPGMSHGRRSSHRCTHHRDSQPTCFLHHTMKKRQLPTNKPTLSPKNDYCGSDSGCLLPAHIYLHSARLISLKAC